jgi:hypothetical protein
MEYGDGWAEVEIEGRRKGIVPASYVSFSFLVSLTVLDMKRLT